MESCGLFGSTSAWKFARLEFDNSEKTKEKKVAKKTKMIDSNNGETLASTGWCEGGDHVQEFDAICPWT